MLWCYVVTLREWGTVLELPGAVNIRLSGACVENFDQWRDISIVRIFGFVPVDSAMLGWVWVVPARNAAGGPIHQIGPILRNGVLAHFQHLPHKVQVPPCRTTEWAAATVCRDDRGELRNFNPPLELGSSDPLLLPIHTSCRVERKRGGGKVWITFSNNSAASRIVEVPGAMLTRCYQCRHTRSPMSPKRQLHRTYSAVSSA